MKLLCAYFLPWFPSGCKNATRRMFKGRKEPGIADMCVCTFHPHSRASVSHLMEAETEAGVLVCSSGGRAPPRQPGPSFLGRPAATTSHCPRRGHCPCSGRAWPAHHPGGSAQAVYTTDCDSGPQPSMLLGHAPLSGGPGSAGPRVCLAPVPRIRYQFDFWWLRTGTGVRLIPQGSAELWF